MSDISHSWIDERLRDAPLPPELLPRLREIATLGDNELDYALREVAMPPALLERLRAIGSLTDADLEDEARHVPLPRGIVPRLCRSLRRQANHNRLARLAIAASLFLALGGAGWLVISQLRPGGDLPVPRDHSRAIAVKSTERPTEQPSEKPTPAPLRESQLAKEPDSRSNPQQVPAVPAPAAHFVSVPPAPSPPDNIGTLPNIAAEPAPPLNMADILGNSSVSTQPDLRVARGVARRGVAGPRVKGYDLLFELSHGEHPVVHPGQAAAPLESRVPIWTDTSSYELVRRAIAARQPLPAGQVRAEDFLAAMDYQFPTPSGSGVGIRTAAGPSPYGSAGMSLIQIGVRGGAFDRGRDIGTHLTLVIDFSATMAIAERWEAIRRALDDLADQLGPRDRLSIVLFNSRPTVLVRQADRAEMRKVLPTLATIVPRGLANLGAALEMAAAVARQEPIGSVAAAKAPSAAGMKMPAAADERPATRLILLTDGIGWIDPNSMPRSKELLKETVAARVSWEVVDVRPDEVFDPRLEELAAVGGKSVRHAETGRAIARELREALIGRRDVVAAGVSVRVTFNPEAIESYRLIGHDPTTAGGLISGPLEGDLRAGEAATALYEVELKPDGSDMVAMVDVSWHEPGTEKVHRLKQPIGRLQFAPSWMETPLSLQLATLAAETAELLRGSYFAPTGSRPLDQIAELADRANGALQDRPSFRDLKALLDAARASRTLGR